MKELLAYVLKFGNLNPEQIAFIAGKATELHLHKDQYYLEAGKIARQFGFVLDGIARVCYYNNKAEEITKYFIEENNILVYLTSFDNEIPSVLFWGSLRKQTEAIFQRLQHFQLFGQDKPLSVNCKSPNFISIFFIG